MRIHFEQLRERLLCSPRVRRAIAALALTACLPAPANAQLGGAISNPLNKKASHLACDALGTLSSLYGPSVPSCSVGSSTETYYNGSAPLQNTLSDLFIMPYVTDGAYYCSIADAHGAQASATTNALGKFGMESKLRVFRDPANMTLKGERIGTLWLFGAGLAIEAQDFEWSFPSETTSSRQWGGYMKVKQEGVSIDWDPPAITIPVPMPVGVASVGFDFNFFIRNPHEKLGNNLLQSSVPVDFSYSAWQQCPSKCMNLPPGTFCTCDSLGRTNRNKVIADHQVSCSGTCAAENDGLLPYVGAFGGASGRNANYLYVDPFVNWLQFGRSNPRKLVSSQRTDLPNAATRKQVPFDINTDAGIPALKNQATTGGSLGVWATYQVPLMRTDLLMLTTFGFRDGFSVQQEDETLVFDLGTPTKEQVRVWTDIDAESAIDVDLALSFDLNLPLFDPGPVTINVPNLYKNEWFGRSAQLPSEAIYSINRDSSGYTNHSAFTSYKKNGVVQANPDGYRNQCLQAPKTNHTPSTLTNANDFVKNVAKNVISSIHPCDFTFCSNGRTYTYRWDVPGHTFNTSDPGRAGCHVCENKMNFCDGANQPIMKDLLDTWGNPVIDGFGNRVKTPMSVFFNWNANGPASCIR